MTEVCNKSWGNPGLFLTSSQAGSSLLQYKIPELRPFCPPVGMGITRRDDWRDQCNGGEWEENCQDVTTSCPTVGGLITIRFSSLRNTFLLLQSSLLVVVRWCYCCLTCADCDMLLNTLPSLCPASTGSQTTSLGEISEISASWEQHHHYHRDQTRESGGKNKAKKNMFSPQNSCQAFNV